MYCNKCGRAVREGDIFCSHCGNKLPIETKIDIPEVQTTYEPITPPGAEQEVYLQTGEPAKPAKFVPQFEERKTPKKESEFNWNTEDFKRTPKNTADYEVDWQKLQIYEKHPDGSRTIVDEPVTEQTIKEDVQKDAVAKDAAKIEKFYTFNKKLDEYQKLLDSEYDRVNKGRREAVAPAAAAKVGEIQKAMKEGTDIDWDAISSRIDVESREAVQKQAAEAETPQPEVTPAPAAEPQPEPAPAAEPQPEPAPEEPLSEKDLEIQQKNFEGRFTGFFEAIQSGEPAVPSEGEGAGEEETGSLFDPVKHLQEAEQERASVEAVAVENSEIVDNDTLMKRFDTKELEKDVLEIEIEKERRRRAKAAEEAAEAPEAEEPAKEEAPAEEPPVTGGEPAAEEPAENPFDVIFGNPDEEKETERQEQIDSEADDLEDAEASPEDGEEGSKGSLLKILIVIAAILLGAELVLIGVQQLAPNSGFAKYINEHLQGIVLQVGNNGGESATTDDEALPEEDEPVVAEGVPFTVKELAEHAKNFNNNIVEIKSDKNLCYNPTETYKEARIAESQPLEYNIWYKDLDGNPVYSDMAVADTLVKYNSMWIDYINDGDETVFTVIAPDSKVYTNCKKATTKASEKIMKELTIGEVRKTEGGFLIWDREVITTTTKSGDVTTATYEMVYFLQDSAYELKVAECYTLKSN